MDALPAIRITFRRIGQKFYLTVKYAGKRQFKREPNMRLCEVEAKALLFNGGIAPGCRFTSTEQTGTASPQNVAHGLGSTPSMVWFSVSEASGAFDVAPGAHDATNCVFTVTSGVKFYVHALK